MAKKFTQDEKALMRRYLIWCYKTTKEELDRIDRKFTQLKVDEFLLKELKSKKNGAQGDSKENLANAAADFEVYMSKKKTDGLKEKYKDQNRSKVNPNYEYLNVRLRAIENAIRSFFSKKEVQGIKDLYEKEMTQRILQAREHT